MSREQNNNYRPRQEGNKSFNRNDKSINNERKYGDNKSREFNKDKPSYDRNNNPREFNNERPRRERNNDQNRNNNNQQDRRFNRDNNNQRSDQRPRGNNDFRSRNNRKQELEIPKAEYVNTPRTRRSAAPKEKKNVIKHDDDLNITTSVYIRESNSSYIDEYYEEIQEMEELELNYNEEDDCYDDYLEFIRSQEED